MKSQFAVLLYRHRLLGPLLSTVILNRVAGKEFYVIADRVSTSNLRDYESVLAPDDVRLVTLTEEYSDNSLLKVFTKKKTNIHDFLSSCEASFITDHIRPYIERRIGLCMSILTGNDIPVFQKKLQNNIYGEDRLYPCDEPAMAGFIFKRTADGIFYSVNIKLGEEDISLNSTEGYVLVNEPCIVVCGNRIITVDDIDGKKVTPFFKKPELFVRKESEKIFLENFAKKIIRNYDVITEGIEIRDVENVPKTLISLENNLSGIPELALSFIYDEKIRYEAGKKSELNVRLDYSDKGVEFIRLIRNPGYENSIISALLEAGLVNTGYSYFHPLRSKKSAGVQGLCNLVEWLNENDALVERLGIKVILNKGFENYYTGNVELEVNVNDSSNDWFDINVVVLLKGYKIPFTELRNNILNGIREYKLPGGEVFVIPEPWFARFRDVFTFSNDGETGLKLQKQHFALLDNLQENGSSWYDRIHGLLTGESSVNIDIPADVNASLRDYQKKGYRWMCHLNTYGFGGCLADDMGLGKTLQTLAVLQKYLEARNGKLNYDETSKKTVNPALVVAPSSVVHNWINEAARFVPLVKTVHYGGQNRNPFSYYYENYDLIVSSYGLVRNNSELLKEFKFSYIVLDEAQVIKNPHSKTYKTLMGLSAENRLILTGTPIENSLSDLWAQMNFLNHGLLGGYEFFNREYIIPVEKNQDQDKTTALKRLIEPFVMRRTKTEVAPELPELSKNIVYCEMTPAHQEFYDTEKSKVRNLLLENMTDPNRRNYSIMVLKSMTRLRLAANHPVLVDEDYADDSGKFETVIEHIRNLVAEKHKVLVFSSFVKHLSIFSGYCQRNNLPYVMLTGSVPQGKREDIISKFTEDKDTFLFLISIKAGGFGLNLTAADYVFILDPWWNPAVEEQALSRAYRIGQRNKVFVYRFISKDTIEDKIKDLQERKSLLAEKFINSNNPFTISDREELIKLI